MVNISVVVLAGEPLITKVEGIRVTIDCGQLIDEMVDTTGITNPIVTWFKDGAILRNRTASNVIVSANQRFCVIVDTFLALGSQLGTDGNYSCEVCSSHTNCQRNDTSVAICGKCDMYICD